MSSTHQFEQKVNVEISILFLENLQINRDSHFQKALIDRGEIKWIGIMMYFRSPSVFALRNMLPHPSDWTKVLAVHKFYLKVLVFNPVFMSNKFQVSGYPP